MKKFNMYTILVCLVCLLFMPFSSFANPAIGAIVSYESSAVMAGALMANGMNPAQMTAVDYATISQACLDDAPSEVVTSIDMTEFRTVSNEYALASGTLSPLVHAYVRDWLITNYVVNNEWVTETTIGNQMEGIFATFTSTQEVPTSILTAYNNITDHNKILLYKSGNWYTYTAPNEVYKFYLDAGTTGTGTSANLVILNNTTAVQFKKYNWNGTTFVFDNYYSSTAIIATTNYTIYKNNHDLPVRAGREGAIFSPGQFLPADFTGGTVVPVTMVSAYAPNGSDEWTNDGVSAIPVTLPYTDNPDTNYEIPVEVGADTVIAGANNMTADVFTPGNIIETITGTIGNWIDLVRTDDVPWQEETTVTPPLPVSTVPELQKMSMPALLATKFPLCIPFDIARMFTGFVQPKAVPHWEIPFTVERFGIDENIVLDFQEFDGLATFSRYCTGALFSIILAVGTRDLIRG